MQKVSDIFLSFLRKIGRYRLVVLVLTAVLLCFLGGLTVFLETQKQSLPDQLLAQRWSKQEHYAQLSFYFAGRLNIGAEQIENTRYQTEKALQDAGEEPENSLARLFVDAYAAFGELSVSGEQKSITVEAIGVGGDFFLFHPVNLLSGRCFAESDIRKDIILIDEDVAWQLFGSSDIEGKDVRINDKLYRVAGVFERPQGELEQMAGSNEPTVFLPYEAFIEVLPETPVTVYETLLPNPVKGFALQIMEPILTHDEDEMIVIENSARFSYEAFYDLVQKRALRTMKVNDIVLPSWENLARVKEEKLAEVALLQVCIAALLVLYWIVAAIVFMVRHKPTKEGILEMAERIQGWFRQNSAKAKGKVKKEDAK